MIDNFFKNTTLATTISLFSLGIIGTNQAQAAVLLLGQYGDISSKRGIYLLTNLSKEIDKLSTKTQKKEQKLIAKAKQSDQVATAEQINQSIEDRYQGLVEEDTEKTGLIAANKKLVSEGILEKETPENPEQNVAFLQSQGVNVTSESKTTTLPLFITLFLLISSPFFYSLFVILKSSYKNLFEELQDKFGNPQVPEGTVFLHDRAFKELLSLARKAERVDSEKFTSQEFLLLVRLKKAGKNGTQEEQQLHYSVELLRVAIATQNSFLRVEQTELRFRSTKQQEFYQFVLDAIAEEADKDKFRDKVKNKLAEVIPSLNTEEGKDALQAYFKEVNIISEHELGLKLFALFKQYQLADFSILKTISNLIERLEGYDLLAPKKLVILIIENYEVFEKIAPLIEFKRENQTPEEFIPILQYIGLANRYLEAYEKFLQLITVLKQWQKPYQTIQLIREEYTSKQYRILSQFTQEIPGLNLYRKYEKYIE